MANNNSPFGFIPVRRQGGEGSPVMTEYAIASGYATALNLGDPVQLAGDSSQPYGIPFIGLCATTGTQLGVFAGCEYIDSLGNIQFSKSWVASTVPLAGTKIKALVYDDPRTIFKIQASAGCAYTDIPNNANYSNTTGVNGVSVAVVNSSTFATTNTHDLKVLRLFQAPDNALGNYAIVEVQLNRSQWANQTASGS